MTVKELIEELQKWPESSAVVVVGEADDYDETHTVESILLVRECCCNYRKWTDSDKAAVYAVLIL